MIAKSYLSIAQKGVTRESQAHNSSSDFECGAKKPFVDQLGWALASAVCSEHVATCKPGALGTLPVASVDGWSG